VCWCRDLLQWGVGGKLHSTQEEVRRRRTIGSSGQPGGAGRGGGQNVRLWRKQLGVPSSRSPFCQKKTANIKVYDETNLAPDPPPASLSLSLSDNVDLGTSCGRYDRVSCMSITDPGDSDIIKAMPEA
jgi:hypothetical protein